MKSYHCINSPHSPELLKVRIIGISKYDIIDVLIFKREVQLESTYTCTHTCMPITTRWIQNASSSGLNAFI